MSLVSLIDTHCHLNFESYAEDLEAVVARAAAAGVTRIINPAIDLATSQEALDLTARFPGVFAAVGVHPNSSAELDALPDAIEALRQLASAAGVVAIGEIGLDYYWDKSPQDTQREVFEAQLDLASQLGLPVIIHNREASDDVMAVLEAWTPTLRPALRERPGVLHSFSAPRAIAERALDIGFYLGFTGPVTYKNADDLRSTVVQVPLDRLVVETDGPFLTPTPHRGKRNEPAYIPLIVERLATVKQIAVEDLAAVTTENAIRLFSLPDAKLA